MANRVAWPLIVSFLMAVPAPALSSSFVEEVSCGSDSLTVMLDRTDGDLQRWLNDPQAQPVAYVYGHKSRTPCGVALKAPVQAATASGGTLVQPVYNFSIPYGPSCDVTLTDLEPSHRTAETTIAIEDNALTDPSKNVRMTHVFCVYARRAEALRVGDVRRGHEVVDSVGGKPQPKVALSFATVDDRPLTAAKFGDTVKLKLHLDSDQAYKAILPKECMFSDQQHAGRPGAKRLTFVQSQCPVKELEEIVAPLRELTSDTYYTQFKTFRFGDQSTVYAHCTVQVCLDPVECNKSCFTHEPGTLSAGPSLPPGVNFTDESALPDERRRRRLLSVQRRVRRSTADEVAITGALTILDEREASEVLRPASSASTGGAVYYNMDERPVLGACTSSAGRVPWPYYALVICLCIALLASLLAACVFKRKLKLRRKEMDLGSYSMTTRAMTHSAVGSVYSAWPSMPNVNFTPSLRSGTTTLPRRPVSIVSRCGGPPVAGAYACDATDSMRSVSEMSVHPPVTLSTGRGNGQHAWTQHR